MTTQTLDQPAHILNAEDEGAATIIGWSDRTPATIIRQTAKTITVRMDRVEYIAEGMRVFLLDLDGPERTYSLRANGRYIAKGAPANSRGASLSIGQRSYYRDPSF